MATLREIKTRINSIKSTEKITKAMEMMAASKMKKAQQLALSGRPYLETLSEVINNLIYLSEPRLKHPLIDKKSKNNRIGYILITSNRGLCGGFNTSVNKKMIELLNERDDDEEIVVTIGTKGRQVMERIGMNVLADFEELGDRPSFFDTLGISQLFIDDFIHGKFDKVYMVYNHFYSTLSQIPKVKKLLPIEMDSAKLPENFKTDYIFEADKQKLLDKLLRRYLQISVYQTILESQASEHSARMMAMRKASDNASEIISNLTLHYNKARQTKITTQILEVVSGSNIE